MKVLVLVRYFAPSTRAVGVTTRRACLALPAGTCRVLAGDTTFDSVGAEDPKFTPDLPVERVTARIARLFPSHPLPHSLDYALALVQAGVRLYRREPFDAIIAHYPDRFTLMAGLALRALTRRPLALHMHDYFSEGIGHIHPVRLWWWKLVEQAVFAEASLLIVPTPRFAEQYRRRGYENVFVLPHLGTARAGRSGSEIPDLKSPLPASPRPRVPASLASGTAANSVPDLRPPTSDLHVVFTGFIYEAHLEATEAFVKAAQEMPGVRLSFATQAKYDWLAGVSVGFVPRQRCLEMQDEADAVFLPLGINSIYPLELQSCLPSKLLDYLAAGKAVFAVVPPGSYVAELIERYGFGVAVTTTDPAAIRAGLDRLR